MKKFLMILMVLAIAIVPCGISFGLTTADWKNGTTIEPIRGTINPGTLDTESYDYIVEPLDRLLSNYRENVEVEALTSATITVTDGEIVCSNTAGTIRRFRKNTSDTTVTWTNIDTGSEENSTYYYVYAAAEADASTFTVVISKSSTSPTGVTHYKKLGEFYNNSSGNITLVKSYKLTYDSDASDPDYDSGWFTANVATLYTKAHSISLTFPTDGLEFVVFWRSSSSGSYITNCLRSFDASENTEGFSYDGTNFYLKASFGWARYYDSSGTRQTAGNGELRVLAWKR